MMLVRAYKAAAQNRFLTPSLSHTDTAFPNSLKNMGYFERHCSAFCIPLKVILK